MVLGGRFAPPTLQRYCFWRHCQSYAPTQLSCHRFRSDQLRLGLSVLAYNLGNLWRRLALPRGIEKWSLTNLQQRLVKTGGRLVKYARYYWLLLA
ncbi:MAG: transposase [Terriglobales bacterium]